MDKKNDDAERIKRIVELAKLNSEKTLNLSPKDIFNQLDGIIIGNDKYKKAMAITLADFLKQNFEKNHMLVIGPSGSGKTFLLEKVLPELKVPFYIIDCASLVPSGYKGKSLNETIEFFLNGLQANTKNIIILDEFDKVSTFANGGDDFKSQSIQSELLILLSGMAEGKINTKNTLWILAGAFAYADESKDNYEKFNTQSLIKYGFKNELVGRIAKLVKTEVPTIEEVVKRIFTHPSIINLLSDMKSHGYDLDIKDEVYLEMATFCQNPSFGMRGLTKIIYQLKEHIMFERQPGPVIIDKEMMTKMVNSL